MSLEARRPRLCVVVHCRVPVRVDEDSVNVRPGLLGLTGRIRHRYDDLHARHVARLRRAGARDLADVPVHLHSEPGGQPVEPVDQMILWHEKHHPKSTGASNSPEHLWVRDCILQGI